MNPISARCRGVRIYTNIPHRGYTIVIACHSDARTDPELRIYNSEQVEITSLLGETPIVACSFKLCAAFQLIDHLLGIK